MFDAPPVIETEIFTRLPEDLRLAHRHSDWAANRGPKTLHSFLEGPSFDREGNLLCVDIPHGRIFKISPSGDWTVFAEYDGEPNGLKIHADGRIFVADHRLGLLCFDPVSAAMTVVVDRPFLQPLAGLNDLVFGANGDLYFTDPGQSAYHCPNGRVFRLRASGEVDLLLDALALPNGLVLNRDEDALHVAITKLNHVITVPLKADYRGVGKVGVFVQMSGGTGPDGMALDADGGLAVVHAGFGTVWLFSPVGEPLYRIKSCAGPRTTNIAFGGADGRTLYITEADSGSILTARVPTIGKPMFSHSPIR